MAAKDASAAARLSSYLSSLSPVPSFPQYTGPHKVGTMDLELPVADFQAPSPRPQEAANIPTVQFRIFYPAVAESDQKPITWLPNPQRNHVSAYTQFLGVKSALADFLAFLPRHLYYTHIPVHKNATLQQPNTPNGRWPTMVFSHGLGGSRNSYSYIAGSLASHGVVVVCPEHRDRSAVATFVRVPSGDRDEVKTASRHSIAYQRISHDVSPEVYEARESQLRIRLWEMGLIHESILALDRGSIPHNLNSSTPSLAQFAKQLHVHEPGSIIFGGHSFGATTTFQLLKSTYYADDPAVAAMDKPLFSPAKDSEIRKQITPSTPAMLLDMWCLPLLAPNSAPLFNLPMPSYADVPSAPGGTGLLCVESEGFYKWEEHLHTKARLLSADPTSKIVSSDLFKRSDGTSFAEPNFFYVVNSAHLSQSDFGILFPWLTKKIFDADQPERALRLNLRAQLQFLRANGVPVAPTSPSDLVDGAVWPDEGALEETSSRKSGSSATTLQNTSLGNDAAIFGRAENGGGGVVDYWKWISTLGLGDAHEKEKGKSTSEQLEEADKEMEGEIEPAEMPQPTRTLSHVSAAAA